MNRIPHRKTRETFNVPGEPHELTFTCFKYRKFLHSDRTRWYVIDALSRFPGQFAFDLWAYVIMPEHVHLVVFPRPDEYDMAAFLKSFKQSVARRAINYLLRSNPGGLKHLATGMPNTPYAFWMDGPGYDRNVKKKETLEAMVNYIHNNPVRRGLVEEPEEWIWSSAREWQQPGSGHLRLDLESYPY